MVRRRGLLCMAWKAVVYRSRVGKSRTEHRGQKISMGNEMPDRNRGHFGADWTDLRPVGGLTERRESLWYSGSSRKWLGMGQQRLSSLSIQSKRRTRGSEPPPGAGNPWRWS